MNKQNPIITILMERDGVSLAEATQMLADARSEIYAGEDPEEVLSDHFGLEPDYLYDIIYLYDDI